MIKKKDKWQDWRKKARGGRQFDEAGREGKERERESERGREGDDVKWNNRKCLVGLKRSKKSHFQKPRCQKMETNLLWMAGSLAPTCKLHCVSRSSAETMPAPDERESEHDGRWLYMEEWQRFLSRAAPSARQLCIRLTESIFITVWNTLMQ